ncbi:MAG: DUF1549 and DUF1553 domain-containing protein [Rubripirellula sp.]|nr:DUF1549 and DUF1553 domain-containing protein [Rubripirellula sp.]
MMRIKFLARFIGAMSLMIGSTSAADLVEIQTIDVYPNQYTIEGSRERLQLVVTGTTAAGVPIDLTSQATYQVITPGFVSVDSGGRVVPTGDGQGVIQVSYGKRTAEVQLSTKRIEIPQAVSFDFHALPVLAQTGCSGGSCHGSPNGKAGFRLSLFGSDRELDRVSLTRTLYGRRINSIEPEKSLLLMKPVTAVAHQGGKRFDQSDLQYQLLHDWIEQGAKTDQEETECVGIEIFPTTGRILTFPHATQQLSVVANFADGSRRDVTHLAKYEASDPKIVDVNRAGLVRGIDRGESAIIVRYLHHIEAPLLTLVRNIDGFVWTAPSAANYVDQHVYDKLKQLQYLPGERSDESTFLRRVYLDTIGSLPTDEEITLYMADQRDNRRQHLVERLLGRPEYAKFWAQKWGDLLRVSTKLIGNSGVHKFSRWLESSVASNTPYDQFARDILLAKGSTRQQPAGNFFRSAGDTSDAMETATQVFLGTRIQCAKCHNHPFERWTQSNYYGLSSFFDRLQRSKTHRKDEALLWSKTTGEVIHPATGKITKPWVPVAGEIETNDPDRRVAFTNWLTSPDNPLFAKIEVNRIWAQLHGRGIVEPFDDFRDSNPPANGPLLDALAKDFVDSGYDRRQIIRTILLSNTYQATSEASDFNASDLKYFSHYSPRMLTAEQLIDALGEVTGKPKQFFGVPKTTKATWIPAPDLKPHDRGKIGSIEFLKVFGQPERQSACECERAKDVSLGQALELLNGKTVHDMLTAKDNLLHRSLADGVEVPEVINQLYRRALTRDATKEELEVHLRYIESHAEMPKAMEDTYWAIMNRNEFLFQH